MSKWTSLVKKHYENMKKTMKNVKLGDAMKKAAKEWKMSSKKTMDGKKKMHKRKTMRKNSGKRGGSGCAATVVQPQSSA